MRYLLKIFIFIFCYSATIVADAQIIGVQYGLFYNTQMSQVDCFLHVHQGQATSTNERLQLNAQISIVTPTGIDLEISESYMPLTDNQNLEGTTPLKWMITSKVIAPDVTPHLDYYGITPTLAPASFYNNIQEGDLIKLFSVSHNNTVGNIELIRLFENGQDAKGTDKGMRFGDFSNGFTIGKMAQAYKGNVDVRKLNGTGMNVMPRFKNN